MKIEAIRTHRLEAKESLVGVLDRYLAPLEEGSILAITSKIVSLCQGRVVSKESFEKIDLIRQEADAVAQTEFLPYGHCLTITQNRLSPSAGIDESNSQNAYILLPENPQEIAASVWSHIRQKQGLTSFGVMITDSQTTPLRWGVTGIALGWCGFEPLYSYVGEPDLYGNPLRVTRINLLDALATSAVLVMGEGREQTPLCLIKNAPKLTFLSRPPTLEEEKSLIISPEEDLYAPLLLNTPWIRREKK